MADTKARLEVIPSSPSGITDPFDSVYKIVFQLTMRTVGCNEIADDPTLLAKTLSFFETIAQSGTPAGVIFPWLPTPAKLKRTYAGGSLYMIFRRIVNERKRTGKREDDALQFMIDQGDDVRKIISVSTQGVTAWGDDS
jgi:cytochrome P450